MSTSGAAYARAKVQKIPRREAIKIVNSMSRLVAMSNSKLKVAEVVMIAYEIWDGDRVYIFEKQPFAIVGEISKMEYIQSMPPAMRTGRVRARHFYEIHTD